MIQEVRRAVAGRGAGAAILELHCAGKPLGKIDFSWFADARNYAMYANDRGQYDDLADVMKMR
jgi:hypothetical protein